MAENESFRVLDLIVKELAEVLHIHLALLRIHHSNGGIQHRPLQVRTFNGADHVRKLANARGLDQDAIGMVFLHHLSKGATEIAHQGATDAPGIDLVHGNARVLQEAAVNADLAKFVFDQDQLLALVALADQLVDQRGLTSAEKPGKNVDLCHNTLFVCLIYSSYYSPFFRICQRVCAISDGFSHFTTHSPSTASTKSLVPGAGSSARMAREIKVSILD